MSSAGHIFDMIKRVKGNRKSVKSRSRFKENTNGRTVSEAYSKGELNFPEPSQEQSEEYIRLIRKRAFRRNLIYLLLFGLLVFCVSYFVIRYF